MLLTLGLFFTSYPVYASEYVKDANGTEIVNEEQNEKESNDSESNEYVNDNSEESTELYQNTEVSEYHDADVNEVNKKVDIDEKKQDEVGTESNEDNPDNQEGESKDDEKKDEHLKVNYVAHVQNIGWQNQVTDGMTAGTTGKNFRWRQLKYRWIIQLHMLVAFRMQLI